MDGEGKRVRVLALDLSFLGLFALAVVEEMDGYDRGGSNHLDSGREPEDDSKWRGLSDVHSPFLTSISPDCCRFFLPSTRRI